MKIGENIKNIRKKKKMSQVYLACTVGKASTYICDIENGRALPSMKTLVRIAEILDVDIVELLKE